MKKLTIAVMMLFSTISLASAEIGLKVGISGNMTVFHATGQETNNDTTTGGNVETSKEDATALAGYSSIFIEKSLPGPLSRISIGIDYVMDTLSSDTVENDRQDHDTDNAANAIPAFDTKKNKVKVDFEDLTTIYLTANITDNFYVKAGMVTVDVNTKEDLATGSKYGNTDLEGTSFGIGASKDFDNGMFIRVEGNYIDLGGASLKSTTNSHNTVKISQLEGGNGRISIGKSF